MNYAKDFASQGFFVVPEAVGPEDCAALLQEVIDAYGTSPPTAIKNPEFRRHTPLPLSATVSDALTTVLEHGHDVLADFLKNEQELVELSSITVFPNAAEQPLHRDEANEGHYLGSVFVNLAATKEEVGALQVVPGSHRLEEGGNAEAIALELPQGSAVFMNSKLLHCGGANTSADQVRTVFYFTVGEPGLYGPPYSMLKEVSAQHLGLGEFRPQPGLRRLGWNGQSRPQLSPECRILMPLSDTSSDLLLARGKTLHRSLAITADNEFLVDLLECIEEHPRELMLDDLAHKFDADPGVLIEQFTRLARDGWLRC